MCCTKFHENLCSSWTNIYKFLTPLSSLLKLLLLCDYTKTNFITLPIVFANIDNTVDRKLFSILPNYSPSPKSK